MSSDVISISHKSLLSTLTNKYSTDHREAPAVDLRTTLLTLAASIERQYLEVGRVLLRIRDEEAFLTWGFETFETFCDTTLQFKRDKIRYLMRVAATIDGLRIPADQLTGIAWSKLLILAPVLTSANSANWLAKARIVTAQTLRDQISVTRGFALPEGPLTTFVVRLNPTQRQTLDDAIALSMRVAETTSRAVALISMAQEAISSSPRS